MRRWLRTATAVLSCALLGCANDVTRPTVTLVDGGRIAGRVRAGGSTVTGVVRAQRIIAGENSGQFSADVERNGTFQLDVPAGRYVLQLYTTSTGARFDYRAVGVDCGGEPDTLMVDDASSPVTANFDLATARVRVDLPRSYNDSFAAITLHEGVRMGERPCIFSTNDRVRNGALEVTLSGIAPGAYRVELELDAFGSEALWLPGVRDSADATWFDVASNQTVDIAGSTHPEPASIHGKVSGAWLEMGLPWRPNTWLFGLDSTVVQRGTVGVDGRFGLQLALAEPTKMLVEHLGIRQWYGGRSFAEAEVFPLQPGTAITGIDFVQSALQLHFQSEAFVTGTAWGRLFDAATLAPAAEWSMRVEPSGVAPIPNLLPGSYVMRIESGSPGNSVWAPQWFDRAETPLQAMTITLGRGEIMTIPLSLEKGGTIAGSVRDPSGDVFHRVRITTADDPEIWGTVLPSSAELDFVIRGLPDGDWKVSAQRRFAPPEAPNPEVWYPSTTDWASAEIIAVRNRGDVTGIDIVLPAPAR